MSFNPNTSTSTIWLNVSNLPLSAFSFFFFVTPLFVFLPLPLLSSYTNHVFHSITIPAHPLYGHMSAIYLGVLSLPFFFPNTSSSPARSPTPSTFFLYKAGLPFCTPFLSCSRYPLSLHLPHSPSCSLPS